MDERFELQNEHETGGGRMSPPNGIRMDLQLFADKIDMIDVVFDMTDKKPIFATLDTSDSEDGDGEDDEEQLDDEEGTDDPLFIPRLTVTDRNLPHTEIGDVVVKGLDGNLYSVSVNNDGEAEEEAFLISTDNIEDGCITGAKLEENTITSRELDMEEIFADTALLNEMLAENLDAEGLFDNEAFLARFDERIHSLATGIHIEGADMDEIVEPDRYYCASTQESDAICNKPSDEPGYTDGFSLDVVQMRREDGGQAVQQVFRVRGETWVRVGAIDESENVIWQPWVLQTDKDQLDTKLDKAGDTMTGPLTLSGDPETDLQAATKQYVDAVDEKAEAAQASANLAQSAADGKVSKSGDIMSGSLTLAADPIFAMQAATKQYVDAKASGAASKATITLSAGTSSWTCSVPGVTASSLVYVSPDASNANAYLNYGQCRVRCYAQAADTLYFQSSSTTSYAIPVNVVFYN